MDKTAKEIIRVAVVGPECTGKSTLSQQLALHYKTCFVPEFAREYLAGLNRPYTIHDIEAISKGQMQLEDKRVASADTILICDTNLVVTKIWAEFKYHSCPDWIKDNVRLRKYAIHLLTFPDIPWEDDPLREHPHLRNELFELYRKELDSLEVNYTIISGKAEDRLKQAIKALDEVLEINAYTKNNV